jgi:hypothetical protein
VGKPAPQSQNRPIKKDPLQPLNLMVPSLVKAEIQRIAQQESIATGLTVSASKVGAAYLEWAIHQDIHQQHEALILPMFKKAIHEEFRAFGNRIAFFLMRIAFASEQTRILMATGLKQILKLRGFSDEIYTNLVDQSSDKAKSNIVTKSPQLMALLREWEKSHPDERRKEESGQPTS